MVSDEWSCVQRTGRVSARGCVCVCVRCFYLCEDYFFQKQEESFRERGCFSSSSSCFSCSAEGLKEFDVTLPQFTKHVKTDWMTTTPPILQRLDWTFDEETDTTHQL